MFLRIIISFILIAGSITALKYNHWLGQHFRLAWVERYLGYGRSYLAFQVIALLVMLFAMMYMFNLHLGLTNFLLSPLIEAFKL